jgi:hypothetical protein
MNRYKNRSGSDRRRGATRWSAALVDARGMGSGLDGGRGRSSVPPAVDQAIGPTQAAGAEADGSNRASLHPKLLSLSGVLGQEAAAFARRYRYAGLGRLQLILPQLFAENDE